ncbi:MAG: HD domain-containing protein [Candidatus Enteromonas sp.]|nr:HD domain-containing protein [Candidatus Enteromonas sp.]
MVTLASYLCEMTATTVEAGLTAVKIGYLTKPFILLATICFVAEYAKIRLPKWVIIALFLFGSLVTGLVFTNDYHHLYYKALYMEEGFGGHLWYCSDAGPLYFTNVALNFFYLIADIVLALFATKRAKAKKDKVIVIALYSLILIAVLGYAAYLSGWSDHYDAAMGGILVDSLLLGFLFSRYRIIDTLTAAKEKAIEEFLDPMVVYDVNGEVIYFNSPAKSLFPDIKIGEKYPFEEDEPILVFHDRSYSAIRTDIIHHGDEYGKTIIFHDITDTLTYQRRLEEDVKERTARIEFLQKETLIAFASIAESRDATTGNHVRRTAALVESIATALSRRPGFQISKETIAIWKEAAPLHDLGKIKISDAILNKKGKLTPEEYGEMKKHAVIGKELIEENLAPFQEPAFVEAAIHIACSHHEWFNGKGYPYGLQGEEIPLEARVMAVADVYDALTSVRPYKRAFTREEALEIMAKEVGTHFDPEVYEAFLSAK